MKKSSGSLDTQFHARKDSETAISALEKHVGKNVAGYNSSFRIYPITRVIHSKPVAGATRVTATSGGGNGDFVVSVVSGTGNTHSNTRSRNLNDITSGRRPNTGDIYLGGSLDCVDSRDGDSNGGTIHGAVVLPFTKVVTNVSSDGSTSLGNTFSNNITEGYPNINIDTNDLLTFRFTNNAYHDFGLNSAKRMSVVDLNTTFTGGKRHNEPQAFVFNRVQHIDDSSLVAAVGFGTKPDGMSSDGYESASHEHTAISFSATVAVNYRNGFTNAAEVVMQVYVYTDMGPVRLRDEILPASGSGQRSHTFTVSMSRSDTGVGSSASEGTPGRRGTAIYGFAVQAASTIRATVTIGGTAMGSDVLTPRKMIVLEGVDAASSFKFRSVEYFLGKVYAPLESSTNSGTADHVDLNASHTANMGGVFVNGASAI